MQLENNNLVRVTFKYFGEDDSNSNLAVRVTTAEGEKFVHRPPKLLTRPPINIYIVNKNYFDTDLITGVFYIEYKNKTLEVRDLLLDNFANWLSSIQELFTEGKVIIPTLEDGYPFKLELLSANKIQITQERRVLPQNYFWYEDSKIKPSNVVPADKFASALIKANEQILHDLEKTYPELKKEKKYLAPYRKIIVKAKKALKEYLEKEKLNKSASPK